LRPTYLEINLDALAHNLRHIRAKLGPSTALCPVVKADAYGHGMLAVADRAVREGVERLAVAFVEEGALLRQRGITVPIVVLGPTTPEQAEEVVRHELTPTLFSHSLKDALVKAARKQQRRLPVHVKVDTGMGRLGLAPEEAVPFIEELAACPEIEVEGLCTHFAVAEDDAAYTAAQHEQFLQLIRRLPRQCVPRLVHCANSAALMQHPQTHHTLVRPGLMVYGVSPFPTHPAGWELKPVMRWHTTIVSIRTVPAGSAVGYGCTYTTARETTLAVLPVGYAAGYRRAFSNVGSVLLRGKRVEVVGSVCMDMSMLDITDVPEAAVGDDVVLMGAQGGVEITATDLARQVGTIPYEILCAAGATAERRYLAEKTPIPPRPGEGR